jgi:predicted ATPase
MAIKKIKVENFKSFKEIDVELGKFNVLIGANASGKSNFVQIFKFFNDLYNEGLDNAVSLQGGNDYLRNINIGMNKLFSMNIVSDDESTIPLFLSQKDGIMMYSFEFDYNLYLKPSSSQQIISVEREVLKRKCQLQKHLIKPNKLVPDEKYGKGEITFFRRNKTLDFNLLIDESETNLKFNRDYKKSIPYYALQLLKKGDLFLNQPLIYTKYYDVSIYNIDSKRSKGSTNVAGKLQLEKDGKNLSIVLNNILSNKNDKRKLYNLVKDLLPFIDDINIEQLDDKSLLLKSKEMYSKEKYLPASFLSDGTINVIAMIVALYFDKNDTIIIEEPEKGIHPSLISRLIDSMKDASKKKQIIITTHNPEIVKHAGLENLLLVTRDKDGFSTITKPEGKKEVQEFLKNDIGLDQLFIDQVLEAYN